MVLLLLNGISNRYMTFAEEQRIRLINQIAFNFNGSSDDSGYWIIGMLSDLTLPESKLKEQIEEIKIDFPSLIPYFEEYELHRKKTY